MFRILSFQKARNEIKKKKEKKKISSVLAKYADGYLLFMSTFIIFFFSLFQTVHAREPVIKAYFAKEYSESSTGFWTGSKER